MQREYDANTVQILDGVNEAIRELNAGPLAAAEDAAGAARPLDRPDLAEQPAHPAPPTATPGAVRRDEVRVARQTKRPSEVPAKGKWIHVDLAEQTLVAYEGDEPVYATVISSGKEGYEPPTGLFAVQQKYISTS